MLFVGQVLEAGKGGVQFRLARKGDAQRLQPGLEGVAPRMFAEHHAVRAPTHILGAHDLIGLAALEHAVLMDPGFVREGVGADNGLVGLHRKARDRGHQPRAVQDLGGVQPRVTGEHIAPGAQRHHHLFQGRVAGPLAEAVDRAFNLPRAVQHPRERVADREPQVVLTMHGKHGLIGVGDLFPEVPDQCAIQRRQAVAHGVGDVDGSGAGGDGLFQHAAQEVQLGTGRVLRRKFDVVGIVAGAFYRSHGIVHNLLRAHAQFFAHVDRGGGQKGMDTR